MAMEKDRETLNNLSTPNLPFLAQSADITSVASLADSKLFQHLSTPLFLSPCSLDSLRVEQYRQLFHTSYLQGTASSHWHDQKVSYKGNETPSLHFSFFFSFFFSPSVSLGKTASGKHALLNCLNHLSALDPE